MCTYYYPNQRANKRDLRERTACEMSIRKSRRKVILTEKSVEHTSSFHTQSAIRFSYRIDSQKCGKIRLGSEIPFPSFLTCPLYSQPTVSLQTWLIFNRSHARSTDMLFNSQCLDVAFTLDEFLLMQSNATSRITLLVTEGS